MTTNKPPEKITEEELRKVIETTDYTGLEIRILTQLCESGDPPLNCSSFVYDYGTPRCHQSDECVRQGMSISNPCCGYCESRNRCESPCEYWRENSARHILDRIEDEKADAERKAKRRAELAAKESLTFAECVEEILLMKAMPTEEAIKHLIGSRRIRFALNQPQLVENPIKEFEEMQEYFAGLVGQQHYPNEINNKDLVFVALSYAFEMGMTEVLNNPEKHGLKLQKKGRRW